MRKVVVPVFQKTSRFLPGTAVPSQDLQFFAKTTKVFRVRHDSINNLNKNRIMARKTVRVEVPRKEPADLIKLAVGIGKQHAKLAAASPITDAIVKMADYIARANNAAALQQTIEELQAQLQNKVGERDLLLGMSEGQNAQTGGTLLFDTLKIRDLLLALNRGNEEALSPWSFNVVVGTAAAPKRKPKTSS